MHLYLVRHARPEGAEGLCYGRRDIRVADAETARAARELRGELAPEVLASAPIYTSPLSRCTALARALVPARAVLATPELLELSFGSWEGCAWSDVPRSELDAWAQDPWGYAPGGGESARAASLRLHTWADRLEQAGNPAVIAVTHAGLIRLALAGGAQDASALSLTIPYGSLHSVVIERRAVA